MFSTLRKGARHPINSIREPFGTAGLIIACVALVAALGGTALAAAKLTGPQKKEVEKIAKKFAGKPGAAGANGAQGLAGTAGGPGAKGDPGAPGTNGTNGTNAEASPFTGSKTVGSVTCTEGGVEVKSAKPSTAVCNGETGFTATLPKGETLEGTWGYVSTAEFGAIATVSFGIPLGATPQFLFVPSSEDTTVCEAGDTECEEFVEKSEEECTGTAAEPTAPEGILCVYERINFQTGVLNIAATETLTTAAGSIMRFNPIAERAISAGTWAVTAS